MRATNTSFPDALSKEPHFQRVSDLEVFLQTMPSSKDHKHKRCQCSFRARYLKDNQKLVHNMLDVQANAVDTCCMRFDPVTQ